jgi:hypothetical protein
MQTAVAAIVERVRAAHPSGEPHSLQGGGSKKF